MGFPGGSAGNESTCNVEDLGSIPGLGRSPGEGNSYALWDSGLENPMDGIVHGLGRSPGEGNSYTLRDSGLENPMDWYSPWGRKELDTTEQLPLPQMYMASQVAPAVENTPASAGDVRGAGLIPGLGRSPGGGHGNPLQASCLENPMDRGA